MAFFSIDNKPEFGPYSAVVGSEDPNWTEGHIRVEPPFEPGNGLYEHFDYTAAVEFDHLASTKKATLLSYAIKLENLPEAVDPRKRLAESVANLLAFLGETSSRELFELYWTEPK
jgi:hypothetical protein